MWSAWIVVEYAELACASSWFGSWSLGGLLICSGISSWIFHNPELWSRAPINTNLLWCVTVSRHLLNVAMQPLLDSTPMESSGFAKAGKM